MYKINKKGMSEVISYILILALAVSLGTFITVWYKSTTEKQIAGFLTPVEGTSQCDEVNVNLVFNYDACSVNVYNTGSLTITDMKITYSDTGGNSNITDYNKINLMPRSNVPLDIPVEGITRTNLVNVNIIPIVMSGKQPYYCSKGFIFNTDGRNFNGC